MELSYNKCNELLEEFNSASKEVFESLKYLVNTYGSSTDNYGKVKYIKGNSKQLLLRLRMRKKIYVL